MQYKAAIELLSGPRDGIFKYELAMTIENLSKKRALMRAKACEQLELAPRSHCICGQACCDSQASGPIRHPLETCEGVVEAGMMVLYRKGGGRHGHGLHLIKHRMRFNVHPL